MLTHPTYRLYCDSNGVCTYSDWDYWIRWVVLGLIIFFFLLAFFLCSCSNARRRRQHGLAPHYGTGWAARPWNRNDPYYQNSNYHQAYPPPPPQYSSNVPDGHTAWNGNYAPQCEMQPPPQAYAGRSTGGDVWSPPPGPPPPKGFK